MTQLNLTFDPGTSLNQILAFKTAGKVWESYLQDDATVNIHVGITSAGNLPSGVIGGALPGMRTNTSYGEFRNRYWQDVTSSSDTTANEHLNWDANWVKYEQVNANGENFGEYTSSGFMSMTRANAKALGFDLSNAQGLDGYILMSNLQGQGINWDYHAKRVNAVGENKLDFVTTALHEIGHVLGFVSGVDESGWISADINQVQGENYTQTWNSATQALRERVKHANPLDLFRYSANSDGNPDLTYGSQFSDKYFSIDGGATEIAKFSSGSDTNAGGDGYQASHWELEDDAENSIMAPALQQGQRGNVSTLDLQAMDVIGWDIAGNGTATSVNFQALYSEAKRDIANQLGQSVSWLHQNWQEAATQVTQDRGDELFHMLENSQYDMSWLNPWATGGGSRFHAWRNFWASGGSQRFQMLGQVFQQEARFSTLDEVIPAESSSDNTVLESRADSLTPTSVPNAADPLLQAPIGVGTSVDASIISTATSSALSVDQASTQASQNSLQDNKLEPLEQDSISANLGSTPNTTETLLPIVPENILSDPLGGLGSDQLLGNGLSGLVTL